MKRLKLLIPMILVIILVLTITGYRFTALSAAKSNFTVTEDFKVIEKLDTDSSVIFLFKSDEKKLYRTVLAEKTGFLYRSNVSTYIPYSSDALQTVGGISFTSDNETFTFLSIESQDNEVAYIEAGVDSNLERLKIDKGERITFLFPFSEQIDSLNATAFNKDGEKLYFYGYPKDTNILEDLKWHKVSAE